MTLGYGLISGIIFGIFLQKAQVLRYDKQVGAMRFIDMTIFKFMLSSIIVSAIGLYLLKDFGLIKLSVKGTSIGAQLVGGSLFGIGWGLLGYCPGTAVGALGEGRLDAFWGILGMLLGAALYAEAYPFMKTKIIPLGSYGKLTLPQALGVNHWLVIVIFAIIVLAMFYLFEKKKV
ncbi:MAG: YeeE/YedE family protein [Deltaproteobacteria bacterium]|nr:YeeE/YedE family protein [Deltaproteobacteria bacterium]